MESYSVRFTEEGKRKLHELHIETQKKIKNSLKELSKDISFGKKLIGRLAGFSSLTVGKYRAIYTIEREIIMIHYVGHREDVYNNFEKSLG